METPKGTSKKKYYQTAKSLQADHRVKRLIRVQKDLESKISRATASGRPVGGLMKALEQIEYALSYQRPQGKKGSPVQNGQPFTPEPPHHRPHGFWNRHERVWGNLARKMHKANGEIVPTKEIDKFLQAEQLASQNQQSNRH